MINAKALLNSSNALIYDAFILTSYILTVSHLILTLIIHKNRKDIIINLFVKIRKDSHPTYDTPIKCVMVGSGRVILRSERYAPHL